MTVDRKLAMEYLKKLDGQVYELYDTLRQSGLSIREIEDRKDSLEKLKLYCDYIQELDAMEHLGAIEIWNDYDHGEIYIKDKRRSISPAEPGIMYG